MIARVIAESLLVGGALFAGALIVYTGFGEDAMVHAQKPAENARGEKPVAADREHFLTHDGRQRRYVVHVPRNHDGRTRLPVVLNMHGALGRPETQRNLSRMNDVADRFGFLVVYPQAAGPTRALLFNAGPGCGYAAQQHIDDVGFIRQLLDDLPKHYLVDPQRVYATGMSNGAAMTYRLACELSDRIAAIGPVACAMVVDGPQPRRPVPVMHFHGQKDPFAPFAGGKGRFGGIQFRSVADTIRWWVKANHCREEPAEVTKGTDYVRTRYQPASGVRGAPVILYALPEGGHTWPGGVDLAPIINKGKLVASVDASTLLWQFFASQSLPAPGGNPGK